MLAICTNLMPKQIDNRRDIKLAMLYSYEETVEQLTGLSLKGTMLTTTQYHDRRHVLPFVLSTSDRDYLLVREIEKGNLAGAGFNNLPMVFFNPYYLPHPTQKVHITVADAVESLVPNEPLVVDFATPASVLLDLRKRRHIDVKSSVPNVVEAYKLTRKDVLNSFNHHRNDVVKIAKELTIGHPRWDSLAEWFEKEPCDSFEILDKLCRQEGLDAVYATWVTNFQELTGLPGVFAENLGCAALYMVGSNEIWLLAPEAKIKMDKVGAPRRRYSSMAKAVKDIAGNSTVGYESNTLFASDLVALENASVDLTDGGELLRVWREEKTGYDIPYFVLASSASRYAIDRAVLFAQIAIKRGVEVSERDVDRIYLNSLRDFATEHKLPVSLRPYFVNNHSGARSIYPARPVNYKISQAINSLKIDAGIFVFDDGLFHACSDMARTVATDRLGAEVFNTMEKVMLEETIPNILPGMTGEDIHKMGVDQWMSKGIFFILMDMFPTVFLGEAGTPVI